MDDYDYPPFFGGFVRLLKYFSFGISVFLPGVYVALGTFHQELIPTNLLFTIASAEFRTPLSLMNEAIMTLIFYEIMREAGLRLPKVVGHAVSIIGAIVIGEATVSAGLIGAPILVIIAITAIASYVAFPLYDSVSVLRLLFILAGGLTGLYGLMLGMAALFCEYLQSQPLRCAVRRPHRTAKCALPGRCVLSGKLDQAGPPPGAGTGSAGCAY